MADRGEFDMVETSCQKKSSEITDRDQSVSHEMCNSSFSLNNRIWLDTERAAEYLYRTVNAIYIAVSRGKLKRKKWNGKNYFKKSDLDRLLNTSYC